MDATIPYTVETQKKLVKADEERSILLSISKEVAAVKNQADLFPIINNTLKKLFSYDDGVICIVNNDQVTHSAYLYNPEEVFAKYPGCEQLATMKFPVNDGIYDVIVASEKVIVFELDEVKKSPNASVYIPFWIEKGMKQLIGVPLKAGSNTIGSFSFYTKKRDPIPVEQFGLLHGLCSQIAIAIQNVLINEQIEKRDYEKTVLLEIGNDLAFSKGKEDLLAVIDAKLKKIISFTKAVIGLIDSTQNKITVFYPESFKLNGLLPQNKIINRDISITDELQSQLMVTNFPEVIDPVIPNSSGFPREFIKSISMQNAKEIAIVALRGENGLIGFVALVSDNKNLARNGELSLLKGVASQLSSAASNILAKEDILKKEREKTLLLSFSNHIATVRDPNGLKFILKNFLKKLFQVKEYLITIRNDENSYSHFLHDLDDEDPNDEGFKIITGSKMPIKGSLTGAVLQSEEPVVFNINKLLREKKYSFPALSFWKAAGAENILGIRLKVADEDIGILWTQPGLVNERLLKGISAQIAIALANAIANKEVERQFNEIQRYKQQLLNEKSYLQEEIETNYIHSEMVGSGPAIQKIYELMSQVAFSNSTVLILGETGTGKELIARAIHNGSPRKDKMMVKINCAALPVHLIESELFGHEKGSFTGAIDQKIGKFELAHNGTLFLDEIGEMPLDLQVKFLRALQEREIERVGGQKTIKVNVRIIAATNRNLQKEVTEGRFRSDLFYRLNVFPIVMPPLRNRLEDIPLLASHFIKRLARSTGKNVEAISPMALQDLMAYNWPGNIRELEHLIERSLLLTTGDTIKQVQLPVGDKKITINLSEEPVYKTIDENERDHIIAILKKCSGKIFGTGGAAEILGIPPSTLNSKIRKLNIKKDQSYKNA